MASKGKFVSGTDGTDYQHRQRVASIYQQMAEAKKMLRLTMYPHMLMFVLIALKLSEDILDRADIFILELQELQIPKPHVWEWLYALSILFVPFAGRAMHNNSITWMRWFHLAIWVTGLGSVLTCNCIYYDDLVTFIQERDVVHLTYTWRNIPLAIVFQAFAILAVQVHGMQLYFSYKLLSIWNSQKKKTC